MDVNIFFKVILKNKKIIFQSHFNYFLSKKKIYIFFFLNQNRIVQEDMSQWMANFQSKIGLQEE